MLKISSILLALACAQPDNELTMEAPGAAPQPSGEDHYPVEKCGYWYQTAGWDSFKSQRDKCKWGPKIPAKEFFGDSFQTGQNWEGTSVRTSWVNPLPQEIFVQECVFPDTDPMREGEFWTVRRIGPYISDGEHSGMDFWQQTKWHERFTKRSMTGRVFARYKSTGELLHYPPLYTHHEHVAYSEGLPDFVPYTKSYEVSRIAASHGDHYGMKDEKEQGLVMSIFKELPIGTGKPFGYYTFDNKLGDTREEGAEPMEWYQEIGFRTTPVQQREVFHMSRFQMGSVFKNLIFDVPQDSASLFWTTWAMPVSGEFLTNWIHTHGMETVIIFKGDPKKFGLAEHYAKPDIWTARRIESVQSARADLTQRAEEAGISWCEGTPQQEEVDGKLRTRMTKLCCRPWKFKKGDIAVMVGLYDGRLASNPGHQHSIFRGEYLLDEEESKVMSEEEKNELRMKNLQFCGENPYTCTKEITLGLKLSAVLFYGGNLPTDTWVGHTSGWAVLFVLVLLSLVCVWCTARRVMKKLGHWPLDCCSCLCAGKSGYEAMEFVEPADSQASLLSMFSAAGSSVKI